MNLIALASPFFILFIILEWLFSKYVSKPVYRLNDTVGSICCGIIEQLIAVLHPSLLVVSYLFFYEKFRIFQIGESVYSWVITFLLVDLGYYAWHRVSHEVNFLWASHVVHHQSEDYHLATALRQSPLANLSAWVFYLPIAVMGFPPSIYFVCKSLNIIYQFWIHTEFIHQVPFMENVLNTPSHHRVHHGINAKYLDKNYGGVLIIWDKIFGSYVKESETPRYGITEPLNSFNPYYANFEYWIRLFNIAKRENKISKKIWLFFISPAKTQKLNSPPKAEKKYDVKTKGINKYYGLFLFAVVLGLSVKALVERKNSSGWEVQVLIAFTLLSILNMSLILRNSKLGYYLEIVKYIFIVFLLGI